jgi:hypothetical protein
LPLDRTFFTTSALNSSVKLRRCRRFFPSAMSDTVDAFVRRPRNPIKPNAPADRRRARPRRPSVDGEGRQTFRASSRASRAQGGSRARQAAPGPGTRTPISRADPGLLRVASAMSPTCAAQASSCARRVAVAPNARHA